MKDAIELTDPAALRALAHPLRARLLGLLRRDGPLTASEAGRRVGESSGSCSYHLRQLARFGLVEEADGARGRERPWRATAFHTSWPDVAATPEAAAAAEVFERFIVRAQTERLLRWVETRATEPAVWQEAAAFGDTLLYLTAEELAGLRDALQALAAPYRDRADDPALRPEGSRPVVFLQFAFPTAEERT